MTVHSLWRSICVGAAVALTATPAAAYDPFYLKIDINQDGNFEIDQGYSSIDDAIDQLNFDRLSRSGNYSGDETVQTLFDLRGLGALLEFPQPGSGDLNFVLHDPAGNVVLSAQFFARSDFATGKEQRADTLEQLKDFLKKNTNALSVILTQLVRFSPIDPLAGNPDSLFSSRMRNDFTHGFTNKVSQIWGCGTSAFNFTNEQPIQVAAVGGVSDIFADAQARARELQAQNEIGIGLLASSTTAQTAPSTIGGTVVRPGGEIVSTSLVIPLSYTAKLDSDPRKKIRFDLPLTYIDTEGAVSYSLGAGLAYTHPLSDVWALTPSLGVGATGSEDLGAAGGVAAYSLTSAYTWRFDSFALSMGNSVGRYESIGLKLGDVEAEAEIANTVFTNGFLLTGPNSLIAKNLVMEYSFVNTAITGDEVYADAYNEVGIAIGRINTTMGVIDSYTKLGLSYLMGDGAQGDIDSIRLNLASRF